MTIKTYNQFITEGLGILNTHKCILHAAEQNLNRFNDDTSYTTVSVKDGACYINVSGKPNEPLSACESDITFMIMPPNYKPNLLVSLESGSNKSNTELSKFQIVNDQNLSDEAGVLYTKIKSSFSEVGKFKNIFITIGY